MRYRTLGKTGVRASVLGFGGMRLPMKGERVDSELATPMIRRGIELGINYLDTGKWYCGQDSERAYGEAIRGLDRSKLYLSTKYAKAQNTAADLREKFETSLRLMNQEYVDFYHLWGISWKQFTTELSPKGGPLEAFLKLKDEGLVRHLSFSFHSKPEDIKPLVDTGIFETMLCQYNLLDRANEDGIAYAASKGLGVVLMGPVGGGRLGAQSEVLGGMLGAPQRVSTAELALRFVFSNPNVSVALSGMSTMQQVEENAATASRDTYLSPEELRKIEQSMQENKRLADLYCTGCRYCMPCPQKVEIPRVFELANYARVYGLNEVACDGYKELMDGKHWSKGKDARSCVQCRECEGKCPQKIPIVDQLAAAHKLLGGKSL
jgi:predicted aldo/keto reductase-like oxidoreductase